MDELDVFIDQFYTKYSPGNIPEGDRRERLKQKLREDFDGYVSQMYAKYSPDNTPDANRLASLKSKYLTKTTDVVDKPESGGAWEAAGDFLAYRSPLGRGAYDFGRR